MQGSNHLFSCLLPNFHGYTHRVSITSVKYVYCKFNTATSNSFWSKSYCWHRLDVLLDAKTKCDMFVKLSHWFHGQIPTLVLHLVSLGGRKYLIMGSFKVQCLRVLTTSITVVTTSQSLHLDQSSINQENSLFIKTVQPFKKYAWQ